MFSFLYKILFGILIGILFLPYFVIENKPMPLGCNIVSPKFSYSNAELLIDETYYDTEEKKLYLNHAIFDRIIKEIQLAETYLIMDFSLWNPWNLYSNNETNLTNYTKELYETIINKRIQDPEIPILIITDPINRLYGDNELFYFKEFRESNINVIYANLNLLPDPNFLYSKQVDFWSKFYPLDENGNKIFPNLIETDGEKLTLKQIIEALHLKSNHRNVLIAGHKNNKSRAIIGSFNPSNNSIYNSNLAVLVQGVVADYAAKSELAIAKWSLNEKESDLINNINRINQLLINKSSYDEFVSDYSGITYLSEGKIKNVILKLLDNTNDSTRIDICMLYLSDKDVLKSIESSARRGSKIRLILDQNLNAFGIKKNGIPNQNTVRKLKSLARDFDLEIRWANTLENGKYHSKALRIYDYQRDFLLLGSANFTRKSLGNYNLEANLLLDSVLAVNRDFDYYFDNLWFNNRGFEETFAYEFDKEPKWKEFLLFLLYEFQELTNFSSY